MAVSDLAARIRDRGYWMVVVRPSAFAFKRITDLTAVPSRLRLMSIQRRGWYFPHVGRDESTIYGDGWVGQDTEWEEFHEMWRVSESGQFLHLCGMRYDWDGRRALGVGEKVLTGERIIGMGDVIHRFSEIYEFAGVWNNVVAEDTGVRLKIEVGNFQGMRLVVDDPGRFALSDRHVAGTNEAFSVEDNVVAGMGLEELWSRARNEAARFFRRFGFVASTEVVEDWQRKLGR
jgi:hypothetical protein